MRRSRLAADLHRLSRSPSPTCAHCGAPSQTVEHVVEHCPVLDAARLQLENQLASLSALLAPSTALVLGTIPSQFKRCTAAIFKCTGQFLMQLNVVHPL
jgi:hypothetical protein